MTFLNPYILIGLIAASIPIVLHLLNLKKLKTIEFSTLRFLKELQKTKIRKLKLKQIILLILRTLIIIFIVLAFSRPTIESSLPFISTNAKSSAVILIDNSFSMDLSDEKGNRFKQAINSAQQIIDGLNEGDEIAIIPMADKLVPEQVSFSRNKALLKQQLSKIKISNNPGTIINSLRISERLINKAININKEIFIISDFQNNIFNTEYKDSLKLLNNDIGVYIIPLSIDSKSQYQNLSIDTVNCITKIYQADKLVEIETKIKNNSTSKYQDVVVSMFFNNRRVAQRSFNIEPNQIQTISLAAVPEQQGVVDGYIEIEEDALSIDNKRYFGFFIPEQPKIACFGDNNESKFINFAFSTKVVSGNNNNTTISNFSINELSRIDLTNYELVIICNGVLEFSDFNRIEQYIKNGGSLLLFANDETDINIFKTGIKRLGFGEMIDRKFNPEQPAQISKIDKQHPLFEGVFKATSDNNKVVESPKIYRILANNGGQSIIGSQYGNFLSEVRLSEGKAFYCAVKPNIEWSNFPLTGLFPSIIVRSSYYLSSIDNISSEFIAGNPIVINLPNKFSPFNNFKIIDPNKTGYFLNSVKLPSSNILYFEDTKYLGNYTIMLPSNKVVTVFSINPESNESDTRITKNDIENNLKLILNNKANYQFINTDKNIFDGVTKARMGTELWQIFIILALITVIIEMIIARNTKNELEI